MTRGAAMEYLIVGAGPAGIVAAETLRRGDPAGTITVIHDEGELPYSRMAIPYLLAREIDEAGTHLRHGPGHFRARRIDLRPGRVVRIDPKKQGVVLKNGESLPYDRLLIASGSTANRPPIPGITLPGIENCWTLADSRRIAARCAPGSSER